MAQRSWFFPTLSLMAIFALWLLLAGPDRLLGVDAGHAGMVLLMLATWSALYGLYRLPRGELDSEVSPGEWRARLGAAFMAAMAGFMLLKSGVFRTTAIIGNPDAGAVGRNVVMLLIAWAVVSQVLADRWQGQVQEDERDRDIQRKAASWGGSVLTVCVMAIAVMLGLSPAEELQWATHPMVAHLLLLSLVLGGLFSHAVSAILYWRSRH